MPELPEVHTTATMLNRLIKNKRISAVWTDYKSSFHIGKKNIKDASFFKEFKKIILGQTITSVTRLGKNILIHLSNKTTIIVHMKMTGHLLVGTYKRKNLTWTSETNKELQEPINQHIHFVISFIDGTHLVLSDVRKFAKVTLTQTETLLQTKDVSSLGPDPTSHTFFFNDFKKALFKKGHSQIKTILLDQTILAGIGNIYSDEILFSGSTHPQSIISKIPNKKLKTLFDSTKKLLAKGVSLGGDSTSDYRNPLGKSGNFHYHHQVYQNTNKPCSRPSCKGTIKRLVIRGRSSHFCPVCQKLYT